MRQIDSGVSETLKKKKLGVYDDAFQLIPSSNTQR